MQQLHGTTWWNHSYYTGIRPSALHSLQQSQAGASSTSSAQPLASTQESNSTASSGAHSKCYRQCDVSYARSVREFFERCNLLIAPSPRKQPSPTLLLDAATQTCPLSTASADAATQLPLTEFFLGCIYSKDSLDHSVPPPAHRLTCPSCARPIPTLLLDAAAQTPSHSVASADATTQLPLREIFPWCVCTNDPMDRSVPPPTHGDASSASLPSH